MKKITLCFILLIVCYSGFAQESDAIVIDLANKTPISLPSGDRTVRKLILENAFPGRQYQIYIKDTVIMQNPLSAGGENVDLSADACPELKKQFDDVDKYVNNINSKSDEVTLSFKLDSLQKAINQGNCNDDALKGQINKLIKSCTQVITLSPALIMKSTHTYIITVKGAANPIELTFNGKVRGRWVMNYGFLFTSKGLEPDRYFLEQLATDSFRINKKEKYKLIDLRFTPTIFFSYFLDKNLDKEWNNSLTAGIGFNTQSPVVCLGYNGMYNQNIGFSAGIVFYKQEKLMAQYKEGQIVKENLTDAQLYDSDFFRPALYFSLNLRLGANPFKSKSEDTAE